MDDPHFSEDYALPVKKNDKYYSNLEDMYIEIEVYEENSIRNFLQDWNEAIKKFTNGDN